jgi:hypothetical protein
MIKSLNSFVFRRESRLCGDSRQRSYSSPFGIVDIAYMRECKTICLSQLEIEDRPRQVTRPRKPFKTAASVKIMYSTEENNHILQICHPLWRSSEYWSRRLVVLDRLKPAYFESRTRKMTGYVFVEGDHVDNVILQEMRIQYTAPRGVAQKPDPDSAPPRRYCVTRSVGICNLRISTPIEVHNEPSTVSNKFLFSPSHPK